MKKCIFGRGVDRMPDFAFRMMAILFKIRDRLVSKDKILSEFGIAEGQIVVDYGCGPGSYLKKASELVGAQGRVFAVDIHELAIEAVKKRIVREGLTNVTGLVAVNGKCPLEEETADLIYALDMFHMVSRPDLFLSELRRISKPDGVLIIDNGHQSWGEAKQKIINSKAWTIRETHDRYLKCSPVY